MLREELKKDKNGLTMDNPLVLLTERSLLDLRTWDGRISLKPLSRVPRVLWIPA